MQKFLQQKMKKILILISSIYFFLGCKETRIESKVDQNTLLVASEGHFYNVNLDKNTISWEFNSPLDNEGNRTYFEVDKQNIFMPFESGRFINFDLVSGKIIWDHQIYGIEGIIEMSNDSDQQAEMINSAKPLFFSKPLIDNENILIASSGQPYIGESWLYNFDRTNGQVKWYSQLPTVFNFYSPVKYKNHYFINSAVFLMKLNAENGINTSYGMFDGDIEIAGEEPQNNEENQFKYPIYNQMQTDGKQIFIGDEKGTFYSIQLNEDGNYNDSDISDPSNTFKKNPKAFNWKFQDDIYNFPKNQNTFYCDGVLYFEMKNDIASKSCLFAIDTKNGKILWKKVVNNEILNCSFSNQKIIGNTTNSIFIIDFKGDNFKEFSIENQPLSNIEMKNDSKLIFITKFGVEQFDIQTKKTTILLNKSFNENEHNNVQIKFISK